MHHKASKRIKLNLSGGRTALERWLDLKIPHLNILAFVGISRETVRGMGRWRRREGGGEEPDTEALLHQIPIQRCFNFRAPGLRQPPALLKDYRPLWWRGQWSCHGAAGSGGDRDGNLWSQVSSSYDRFIQGLVDLNANHLLFHPFHKCQPLPPPSGWLLKVIWHHSASASCYPRGASACALICLF